MKKFGREPKVDDEVLILRCANNPGLRFELGTITQIAADNNSVRVRVELEGGGFWWIGRDDFILRQKSRPAV